jgi:hypothetical protein
MKGTVAAAALAGALALIPAGSASAEDITVTSFDDRRRRAAPSPAR